MRRAFALASSHPFLPSLLPSLPPSLPFSAADNVTIARPEAVGLGKALADEMADVARRFEGKGEVRNEGGKEEEEGREGGG